MKTNHTPSPWILGEPLTKENRIQIMHKDAQRPDDIAPTWVVANVNLCMGEESEANARLIACAPELLDACKKALAALGADDCPSIPDGAMVRGRLFNVITKATGSNE
jgi:hypothetical protein